MRIPLGLALVTCVCFTGCVEPAHAGETGPKSTWNMLGTLRVTDAGTICNRTMLSGTFDVGTPAKITIQCDQDSYVLTDVAGVDAGNGIKVTAGEKFPTSINSKQTLKGVSYNPDAGAALAVTSYAAWVCNAPVSGAVSICKVWERMGTE